MKYETLKIFYFYLLMNIDTLTVPGFIPVVNHCALYGKVYNIIVSITVVPVAQPGMIIYPLGQPSGGEDLKSINEAAELLCVDLTVEESGGVTGGTVGGERKYHGKACFELACSS